LFQQSIYLETAIQRVVKYLDVPAFEKGDLFYIQNLVALIKVQAFSMDNS
jgi:hypothetical protein